MGAVAAWALLVLAVAIVTCLAVGACSWPFIAGSLGFWGLFFTPVLAL